MTSRHDVSLYSNLHMEEARLIPLFYHSKWNLIGRDPPNKGKSSHLLPYLRAVWGYQRKISYLHRSDIMHTAAMDHANFLQGNYKRIYGFIIALYHSLVGGKCDRPPHLLCQGESTND